MAPLTASGENNNLEHSLKGRSAAYMLIVDMPVKWERRQNGHLQSSASAHFFARTIFGDSEVCEYPRDEGDNCAGASVITDILSKGI